MVVVAVGIMKAELRFVSVTASLMAFDAVLSTIVVPLLKIETWAESLPHKRYTRNNCWTKIKTNKNKLRLVINSVKPNQNYFTFKFDLNLMRLPSCPVM